METFHILCNIEVNHAYYNRGGFGDFRYTPTAATAHTLKQNGMRFVLNYGRSQISVPGTQSNGDPVLHYTVNGQFSLLFLVTTPNIYLDNISVFADRKPTETLLFSNMFGTAANDGSYTLDAQTVVALTGKQLRIPKTEVGNETLLDSNGNDTQIKPTEEDGLLLYNMAPLDEGIYRLDTKTGTRYYSNVELGFQAKPLALLHISTQASLLDGDKILTPTYRIQIDSPTPFWQYVFALGAVEKYTPENLVVDVNDQSVEFVRAIVNDGDPRLTFTSAVPIRLEDKKEVRFRLKRVNDYDIQDSIILPDLPFPDPGTLIDRKNDPATTLIYVKV